MKIQIHDKIFEPYISEAEIQAAIAKVATEIERDYSDKNPVVVAVLNGSFMFASDLMKTLAFDCEISFVKVKSYVGTESSGDLKQMIGLDTDIKGRDVLVLEDIVDTGNTVVKLMALLREKGVASAEIVTLLHKPDAMMHDFDPKYVGISIPNKFVVGYGLDYDGLGRNYREIYVIC